MLCRTCITGFNLYYEGTNSTAINHFSFFYDPFLFIYICSLCPLLRCLSLSLMHKYTLQAREVQCFTAALHCISVCTLQCMEYGHRPDSYYTAQCAFVAPHCGLSVSIRAAPVTDISLTHTNTHTHTAVQYAQWLALHAC